MSNKLISILKSRYFYFGVGLILIVFGVLLFMSKGVTESINNNQKIDLINGQDWSHIPGAKQTDEGVEVSYLGRAIVNQDGSDNQANPSVNSLGPVLIANSDFRINISTSNVKLKGASFQVYAGLPIIYDEWRYEPQSIRIAFSPDTITLSVWNGSSDNPVTTQSFSDNSSNDKEISIDFYSNSIYIYSNDKKVGSLHTGISFSNKKLWFGVETLKDANWTLSELSAQTIGSKSNIEILKSPDFKVAEEADSLKSNNSKPIGAAVALYPLVSDERYRQLAIGQFSMWTPENEMKAQFIHPQEDVYSFEESDSLVAIAQQNDITIHGHALVFGEANPRWMQEAPLNQREKIMVDHVGTVVRHFKGRVAEWDVINEPLTDDIDENTTNPYRQHIWYQAMGKDYISKALIAARQADPSAKLYINEFGLEEDGVRWNAMLALLNNLKSKGVPIDGVGFQAHVHEKADLIDTAVLRKHIQQLAQMGLVSRISEMDVYGDNISVQTQQYSTVYDICMNEEKCRSFSTWGITDVYGSTTELHTFPLEYGNDLLWDENFMPKPAVAAIKN